MKNLFNTEELSRSEKMRKSRKITTDLTKEAVEWLNNTQQFKVNRQNNIPSTRLGTEEMIIDTFDNTGKPTKLTLNVPKVFHKKNNVQVTLLDISGFVLPYNGNDNLAGRHVEIEVKTGKDSLSQEQKDRIAEVNAAGGISFVFDSMETLQLQIKKFMVEKKLAF